MTSHSHRFGVLAPLDRSSVTRSHCLFRATWANGDFDLTFRAVSVPVQLDNQPCGWTSCQPQLCQILKNSSNRNKSYFLSGYFTKPVYWFHAPWGWGFISGSSRLLGCDVTSVRQLCDFRLLLEITWLESQKGGRKSHDVINPKWRPEVTSQIQYGGRNRKWSLSLNEHELHNITTRVNFKFDRWPWTTIGHLFYVTHCVGIGEFNLELQSRKAQFGSNSTNFEPCDLQIWRMTLKKNGAPLLGYLQLCALFRSQWWIQAGDTVWKLPIWVKIDDFF